MRSISLRLVVKVLGLSTGALALSMLPSLLVALLYREGDAASGLAVAMACGLGLGAALYLPFRNVRGEVHRREGFAIVTFAWVLAALVGAMPFALHGMTPVDSLFESMSGLTTTGASVISNVEGLPRGLLFWRSFTHWLGGIGIIVLFIAAFPLLGVGGRQLFRSEVPGIDKGGLTPRIQETAQRLSLIYIGMTAAEVTLLRLGGMSLFDSFCHTFGTVATGGFSTRNGSVGEFGNLYIEVVIIVFMVMAGCNFALYYRALKGKGRSVLLDRELQGYLAILAGAIVLLAWILIVQGGFAPGQAVRDSSFQVVALTTTTGYTTADFDQWPGAARLLAFVLMWIGGSAGSTGGGLKVIRVLLLAKVAYLAVYRTFRPQEVRALRLGKLVVSEEVQRGIVHLFVAAILVFLVAAMALACMGMDLVTAASAVAANLWNIGPGLGDVGASETYAEVPGAAKGVLILCMLMGRLELMTVLVLFVPDFWRK
jgi:trk system potassium uptake protein TrkH